MADQHATDVMKLTGDLFCGGYSNTAEEDIEKVALLHDAVEDGVLEIETIYNLYGETVAVAVDAISKRQGETNKEYLKRCSENVLAAKVKIADGIVNMKRCIIDKDYSRAKYYCDRVGFMLKLMEE